MLILFRKNSNCLKILKSFPWKRNARTFHEEMCAYQTDHIDLYRIDELIPYDQITHSVLLIPYESNGMNLKQILF